MRVAAIDIGTNTVLLLVAERVDGELRPVVERAAITRLGEGVDRTRALSHAAVARTIASLEEFARLVAAASVERIAVVGTSAMRDARGGKEFRSEVEGLLGVEPAVLSGEEEARLAFVGAVGGLPQTDSSGPEVAVFDIGGGSTEVIQGAWHRGLPRLSFSRSFDIGSVRLTERFSLSDPPSPSELAGVRDCARDCLRSLPPLPRGARPIGVAGTLTTLAAVQLGLPLYDATRVHGLEITAESLTSTVAGLAAMTTASRAKLSGMEPKRADVIVAGGLIAVEILGQWQAPSVVISDRGVRWGLAEELCRG